MACREKEKCILPKDDAHIVGNKIQDADALVIGTPTHWGNMCAPLKLLFDRNVPVFMGESSGAMPVPRQKGKRAVVVTACTTPWPFNFIFPESRGAIRAVKEVLHYGGYKTVGTLTKPGTKKSKEISSSLTTRARRLENELVRRLPSNNPINSDVQFRCAHCQPAMRGVKNNLKNTSMYFRKG